MPRVVSEREFDAKLREKLVASPVILCGSVTGPGRSGAIAAVYASHLLGIPFIPYGSKVPEHLGQLLIVDTASESGATMRKAARRYEHCDPVCVVAFQEPPRVMFWYEAPKPQFYKHESKHHG
jgi:hypothetical protein